MVETEEAAPEVHEAAAVADEGADEPAEEAAAPESSAADKPKPEPEPTPAQATERVEEFGGRLRRWLRARRNG